MRSGLGLASGVIFTALRYCSTELGTAAAAAMRNYLHKQVAVPRQRAKVTPMFRAHTKWSWLTEPWHLSECGRGTYAQPLQTRIGLTLGLAQELVVLDPPGRGS